MRWRKRSQAHPISCLPPQQAMLDQLRAAGTGYSFDQAFQQTQIQAHQQGIVHTGVSLETGQCSDEQGSAYGRRCSTIVAVAPVTEEPEAQDSQRAAY